MVSTNQPTPRKIVYIGTSRCAPARVNTTTPTGGVMQPIMMQSTVITPNCSGSKPELLDQHWEEDGQRDDHHRPDVHEAAQDEE